MERHGWCSNRFLIWVACVFVHYLGNFEQPVSLLSPRQIRLVADVTLFSMNCSVSEHTLAAVSLSALVCTGNTAAVQFLHSPIDLVLSKLKKGGEIKYAERVAVKWVNNSYPQTPGPGEPGPHGNCSFQRHRARRVCACPAPPLPPFWAWPQRDKVATA